MKNFITKTVNFLQTLLAFILGLNFYGFGILGVAVILLVFVNGFNSFGYALVGVFIGKNAQAIKEHFDRIINNSN